MDDQSPLNQKKLYIGNLPWSQTEEDVRALCEPFGGLVSVDLITEKHSGRSKGFAFVEFEAEEAAQAALEELNEKEVDGRNLFVKVARPKQPRREFGGGRDDRRGGYGNRGGGNRGGGYGGRSGGYNN